MSDKAIPPDDSIKIPIENQDEGVVIKSEVGDAKPPEDPPLPQDPTDSVDETEAKEDDMKPRLERLGGEPAPDITPEEFARLQQSGQIHIDPRGRVRADYGDDKDAGVSIRKRRAWYD